MDVPIRLSAVAVILPLETLSSDNYKITSNNTHQRIIELSLYKKI